MRWRLTVVNAALLRPHEDIAIEKQLLHAVLQSCAPTVFVYVQFSTDNPTIKRFFIRHAMQRRWHLAIDSPV